MEISQKKISDVKSRKYFASEIFYVKKREDVLNEKRAEADAWAVGRTFPVEFIP